MTQQMAGMEKNITEGDQVWLSTKPLTLKGNTKLIPKWISPSKVMECLTGACHLHLPSTMCIHPVINLSFLKVFISPMKKDPPWRIKQGIIKTADEEGEVREILKHHKTKRCREYLVFWMDGDQTWELIHHLWNTPDVLKDYLHHYPYLSMPHWLCRAQPQGEDSVRNWDEGPYDRRIPLFL